MLDDTLNTHALKPQGDDFPAPVDIKHDDETGTHFLIPAAPLVEPSLSGYGGETEVLPKPPDAEAEALLLLPDDVASREVIIIPVAPAVPKVALPSVDTWYPALAISLFSLRQFSEVSDAEDPLSIKHLIRKRRQEVATKSRDEAVKMKTWKLEQRMQVVRAMSQKRQDKEEERRARVDARKQDWEAKRLRRERDKQVISAILVWSFLVILVLGHCGWLGHFGLAVLVWSFLVILVLGHCGWLGHFGLAVLVFGHFGHFGFGSL